MESLIAKTLSPARARELRCDDGHALGGRASIDNGRRTLLESGYASIRGSVDAKLIDPRRHGSCAGISIARLVLTTRTLLISPKSFIRKRRQDSLISFTGRHTVTNREFYSEWRDVVLSFQLGRRHTVTIPSLVLAPLLRGYATSPCERSLTSFRPRFAHRACADEREDAPASD